MEPRAPSSPARRIPGRGLIAALALAGSFLSAGCNGGLIGLGVAAAGNSSSGGSAPALDVFAIEAPKVSPCRLRLVATQATQVQLTYDLGAGEEPMSALSGPGVSGNAVSLAAGEVELEWDFASELGDAHYRSGVVLRVESGSSVLTGGMLVLGLGNDIPVVEEVRAPGEESGGNVPIDLTVSDTSSDIVSLLAEWRRADDPPDTWRPATAAGIFPGTISTRPEGVELTFFWNTGVDLAHAESDVRVRFTADDGTRGPLGEPLGVGVPREGAPFRVDNNEVPVVFLDSGPLVANPDGRRGVPVPYRLLDPEGDDVEVVFQWRRQDESFVPLDLASLDQILADPALRREHHICSPYTRPRTALEPLDATSVRLPGLTEADALARDPITTGETLEVLRGPRFLDLRASWPAGPLSAPGSALVLGEGLTALVADAPLALGGDRLREIELATGALVRELASAAGTVCGLALEPGGDAVHVVSELPAGIWRLERIDLTDGTVLELASGFTAGEPVGGVAALGARMALVTLGNELLRIDATDPSVEARVLRVHLGAERLQGLALDPRHPRRVYVGEYGPGIDPGRVLVVDVDTGDAVPLQPEGATPLFQPRFLALEGEGTRLLCGTSTGLVQVLSLGVAGAEPELLEVSCEHSLATGPEGLRLVDLMASGGLEQRRAVLARDAGTGVVVVDAPFAPALGPGQSARLLPGARRPAAPGGHSEAFVWDAADVGDASEVYLRAFPRDTEVGVPVETSVVSKHLRGELEGDTVTLPATGARGLDLADLDGDGDLDLVVAEQDGLGLNWQSARGDFTSSRSFLGTTLQASDVVAADLDGDGDCDLAATLEGTQMADQDLLVLYQDASGGFSAAGSIPDASLFHARWVEAGDMDRDGDLDLVVRAIVSSGISIYFQGPGGFDGVPQLLATTAQFPLEFQLADLDGDLDLDVCTLTFDGGNNGRLGVLFQDSSQPGGFAPFTNVTPPVSATAVAILAADLDGDGAIDLTTTGQSGGLRVYRQKAPGTFEALPFALGAGLPQGFALAAADLDGNGRADLLSSAGFAFLQVAPGSFDRVPRTFAGDDSFLGYVLRVGDLDADGVLDMVTDSGGNGVDVHFGVPDLPSSFRAQTLPAPTSPVPVDVDGDGDLDLMRGATTADGNVPVLFQLSPGVFEGTPRALAGVELPPPSGTTASSATMAQDLDGDGDVDLLLRWLQEESLYVFLQGPPGSWGPPLVLDGVNASIPPVVVDVDGDGLLDLVADSEPSGALAIFYQDTPGSFATRSLVASPGHVLTALSSSLAVGDLDDDGRPDLVAWEGGDVDSALVLYQVAPRSFDPEPRVLPQPATPAPMWVRALDLDLDGKDDLLVSSVRTTDRSAAYYQGAQGELERIELPTGSQHTPVGDLDGDGAIDLLVRGSTSGSIVFCRNLAPQRGFQSAGSIPGFNWQVADFDGDGSLDCAVQDSSDILLYLGHGTVPFRHPPLRIVTPNSTSVLGFQVLDLDGDGEIDLLSTAGTGVDVLWGGGR